MKRPLLLLLSVGCFYGAHAQKKTAKPPAQKATAAPVDKNPMAEIVAPPVKVINGHVVIPYDARNPLIASAFTEKVRKTTLETYEIDQIDNLLKKCIENYNQTQELQYLRFLEQDSSMTRAEFYINLATYQKQYVPVLNEANQKLVWVNAFCYVAGDQWLKEIVNENDGGKCFFNVKLNLTTRKIYPLVVNSAE